MVLQSSATQRDDDRSLALQLNSNIAFGSDTFVGLMETLAPQPIVESPCSMERELVSIVAKNSDKLHTIVDIPVQSLAPSSAQPREHFDDTSLGELSQSIRNFGVLQPLIVVDGQDGRFRIIAGERRWRAAQLAGLLTVPCILREISEHNALEIALIENVQRENLSPIEEARAYQRLVHEHDYTQETIASRIGKDRSTVANALRLLSLPTVILDSLKERKISAGHAKALCSIDSQKLQIKIHTTVISRKLSVRQTEDLIKNIKKENSEPKALKDNLSSDLRHLCDEFKGHLGTKVRITGSPHNGKIEISYYTLEDLDRIADLVLGLSSRHERTFSDVNK